MGTSNSTKVSRDIDNHLEQNRVSECMKWGIILLGTPSSGKTTIYKQLDCLFNDNGKFNIDKYLYIVDIIRRECILFILAFCKTINDEQSIKRIKDYQSNSNLKQIGNILQKIWTINKTKIAFTYRDNQDIMSISYFLDKIEDVMDIKYKLTEKDVLNHHTKSNIITELQLDIKDSLFKIIDNVNKKMYLFENVRGMIFVAALSDYCMMHKSNMNAMRMSIDYFKRIINMKWFKRTYIILFLNKNDIFIEKLQSAQSLSICFGDEWKGPDFINNTKMQFIISYIVRNIELSLVTFNCYIPMDIINVITSYSVFASIYEECRYSDYCYQKALEFIVEKYYECKSETSYTWQRKQIYRHITNATNRNNIEKVFWDTQNILVRRSLQCGGFV